MDHPLPRPDGPLTLGLACTTDLECSAGLTCETALPDGMCTRPCTTDAQCGALFGCHQMRCHPRCNAWSLVEPCRDKYVCRIDGPRAVCVADCRTRPCSTGWTCDANTGLCVDPAAGTIGAPCGVSAGSCDGTPNGVCVSVNAFTGGFCTIPCSPFTKPCPSQLVNAECLLGSADAPYCAFLCDPKAPSCPRPEMSCVSLGGGVDVCLP